MAFGVDGVDGATCGCGPRRGFGAGIAGSCRNYPSAYRYGNCILN